MKIRWINWSFGSEVPASGILDVLDGWRTFVHRSFVQDWHFIWTKIDGELRSSEGINSVYKHELFFDDKISSFNMDLTGF